MICNVLQSSSELLSEQVDTRQVIFEASERTEITCTRGRHAISSLESLHYDLQDLAWYQNQLV